METLYRKHRRTEIAELREVTESDINVLNNEDKIPEYWQSRISISKTDRENGSPKIGDMIARNPKNHDDQWLVAEQYYKDNFALMENDPTAQLKADKAELLEALKKCWEIIPLDTSKGKQLFSEIESLIQKMKQ